MPTTMAGVKKKPAGSRTEKKHVADSHRAKNKRKMADNHTKTTNDNRLADSHRAKSKRKMADSHTKTTNDNRRTGKKGHPKVSAAVLKLQQDLKNYKGAMKSQQEQLFRLRRGVERDREMRRCLAAEVDMLDVCIKTHSERISAVENKVLGKVNGRPIWPPMAPTVPSAATPRPRNTPRVGVPDKARAAGNAPKWGDYRRLE